MVASCLANLTKVYLAKNDLDKSEEAASRALRICEKTLGKEHLHVATCLLNMARVRRAQKQLKDSEECCDRALQIREKWFVAMHPRIAECLGELAKSRLEAGKTDLAATACDRAIAIYDKAFPGRLHPAMASLLADRATLLRAEGKEKLASELEGQSQTIRRRLEISSTQP